MINGFLVVTGIVFWGLVALAVARKVLGHRRVRRLLEGPTLYPYTLWLKFRLVGGILAAARRLGLARARRVPLEVVRACRSARLRDFQELRSMLADVGRLPTIRRGLETLGIPSIFEVPTRRPHRIKSVYTHPQQYPPHYLPGVPARTFYDPAEFEWVGPLEEGYPTIRGELDQLLRQDGRGFQTYVSESQRHMEGWNTFNLFFYGRKFEENCSRCPKTTALLESLPRFERDHIMFSALNPHSRIPPHTGPMNGIIRAHLPMVVPPGCAIRVGPDERTWEEGRVLVFDDSFEHEVWNHSDHVRIVLFLNFWHPCFSPEEIEVLARFRAAYEKSPLGRVHEDNQAVGRDHDLALERIARREASPPPESGASGA